MPTLSQLLREDLLNQLFGNASYGVTAVTIPAVYKLALYAGNSDPFSGGAELTGTNYAAVNYTNAGGWTAASIGKRNKNLIIWPASGVVGSGGWVYPGDVAPKIVFRNGSGPPLIVVNTMTRDLLGWTVPTGDVVQIEINTLGLGFTTTPDTDKLALSSTERYAITDYLLGGGTWTVPGSWDLALYRGSPFAGGLEVVDPAYSRLTRNNDNTEWGPASTGKISLQDIRWPSTGTPIRTWGTVTHLCFCRSGQSPAAALKLDYPVTLGPGQPLYLPAGQVQATWPY